MPINLLLSYFLIGGGDFLRTTVRLSLRYYPNLLYFCSMRVCNTCRLDNGIKIIHEASPTKVVYCGYFLRVGTRHESQAFPGSAHFCEHMTFKGTKRRKPVHIINGMERSGGELNAYTNKDETVYYATTLQENFHKAVDLLTDIVFHSTYPQKEIMREVEVVADEVDSYKDSPAELIYDEFESMLFQQHPLGRDILGEVDKLQKMTTEDFLAFTGQYYVPANATFFVFGDVPFKRIVQLLEKATQGIASGAPQSACQPLPVYIPQQKTVNRNTHQAHVVIGNRALPASDEDFPALFLLNNMVGGPGMNSMLNIALRERAGLVYQVESNLNCYTDTGVWTVYFGCDKHDVRRCLRIADRTLAKLTDSPLSAAALRTAQKQIVGQVNIAADNFESYAIGMAKTFAHHDTPRDVAKFCDRIMALTPAEVQAVARRFFLPQERSTLIFT